MTNDWIERRNAQLVDAARHSQYRDDIFRDARAFIEQGYTSDAALGKACDYWLSSPWEKFSDCLAALEIFREISGKNTRKNGKNRLTRTNNLV
jgi:hypothetical protein